MDAELTGTPPRRLALIVNPSAGGGRAGAALPDVQDALRRLELQHRVETTRSLEHARELAVEAAGRARSRWPSAATASWERWPAR